MNSFKRNIFENQDASSNFTSDWVDISRTESASLQVGNVASADLTGTMKIEVANDEALGENEITELQKSFAKTGATPLSNFWDLTKYGFKKFRFKWVYTSGTGTLTGVLNTKG